MSELPKEWLRLALEDSKTAQVLFKESIWSHACFHAQQAVEKGLKALIESRKEVPKIHDLLELAAESEKCGFDLKKFHDYFGYPAQPRMRRRRLSQKAFQLPGTCRTD